MQKVSAPYNFVPLNEKVFFPPWANLVNHDVPFKDGLSGQIALEITAESPIFIRGVEEVNRKNNAFKQYRFPKHLDRYYIPGSSLKGEISNILEILSFSKLSFFNDIKYSQRDWDNERIYDKSKFANVLGGWLSKNGDGYTIKYSKKPLGRISHRDIDEAFKKDFVSNFGVHFNPRNNLFKAAKKKYDLVGDQTLEHLFKPIEDTKKFKFSTDEHGVRGTIVFTGQSSQRKQVKDKNGQIKYKDDGITPKMVGKHLEFIFWNPDSANDVRLKKDDLRIKNFFFAYYDHSKNDQSIDWKHKKEILNSGGEIPIFISLDSNSKIIHFGLSMLYKLPYDRSVKNIIESNTDHAVNKLDLIDCLFGTINTDEKLKGRVHFEHCFSKKASESTVMFTANLGSPKPTFYPFYIQQYFQEGSNEIIGDYLTYNDGKIAGRKRYPIRNIINNIQLDQLPSKTTTSFYPLEKGATFNGTITFHNLLSEELGALLSALTFHNQNGNLKHSIGMAKPLGLGKCKIITTDIFIENEKIKNLNLFINGKLCLFEKLMRQFKNDWLSSEQLTELFAIATPVDSNQEQLAYMRLSVSPPINDFSGIKTIPKKALPLYSKFMKICTNPQSIKTNIGLDEVFLSKAKAVQNEIAYLNKEAKYLASILKEVKNLKKTLIKSSKDILQNTEKLNELNFDSLVQKETETKAIISDSKFKTAKINVNGELKDVQLIIPDGVDKTLLKMGQIINVIVHQISQRQQKVIAVKLKQQ